MTDELEQILQALKRGARRLTPQRRRILEVVLASDEHLDVDQIRELVGRDGTSVSASTVYRTMRMLVDDGLIKERHFEDGTARFEYVKEGEHHDHLICTRCGTVIEFMSDTIERLQEEVADQHGFVLTGHRHDLYGLCGACRTATGVAPGHGPA